MAISDAQTPVGTFSVASGTTLAKAYGSNVAAGRVLVAACSWSSKTLTCSVAGSLSGAFTAIVNSLATDSGTTAFRSQIFYVVAPSSGAETVTMTVSGTVTDREIVIFELAGCDTVNIPDSSHGDTGSSTNPTGTITTIAQPGRIIAYATGAVGTVTVGAGYSTAVGQNGDLCEFKAYAATGAISVPTVDSSSGDWIVSSAAFRDAAAGGGSTVKQLAALGVG